MSPFGWQGGGQVAIHKAHYWSWKQVGGELLNLPRVFWRWSEGRGDKYIFFYFQLPDDAEVTLLNPPKPELTGRKGKWGDLREQCCMTPEDFCDDEGPVGKELLNQIFLTGFDVDVPDNQLWLCDVVEITEAVMGLIGQVARRNRQIEELRKQLATAKQQR